MLSSVLPHILFTYLSKNFSFKARILPYLIAFNDIHNFPVPIDTYKKLLREEWVKLKPSIKEVNINGVKIDKVITQEDIMGVNPWRGKSYPKTRDENIKILDDYLTLCETNNIRPVIFRVRVTEKYMANFNKNLLDEFDLFIEQALSKHPSACFFDGWKLKDFTYADFYDHEHLNIYGAAKFSAHLNDFIEELEAKER